MEGACVKLKSGATMAPNGDKNGLEWGQHPPAPCPVPLVSAALTGFWMQENFPSSVK